MPRIGQALEANTPADLAGHTTGRPIGLLVREMDRRVGAVGIEDRAHQRRVGVADRSQGIVEADRLDWAEHNAEAVDGDEAHAVGDVQEETGALRWGAEFHRLEGIALIGLNRLEVGQIALEEALRVARTVARMPPPRAAISPDGLYVVFDSNFGVDGGNRVAILSTLAPTDPVKVSFEYPRKPTWVDVKVEPYDGKSH